MMKIRKIHWIAVGFALFGILLSLIFFLNIFSIEKLEKNEKMFWFICGICLILGVTPFFVSNMIETGKEKEKDEMFLEFSRNLVESVKSGTPISRSIINMKNKNYGSLTEHVNKLANQIELGVPVRNALDIFSKDVGSKTVKRAISLIKEAEKAGGEIGNILGAVAKSVSEIDELKQERRSVVYGLIVQGYIIFFVFIIIMLVVQFGILPMTTQMAGEGGVEAGGEIGIPIVQTQDLSFPFLALLIAQGLFAGLTTGKLAEGNIRAGIKHSFILTILALIISTGARVILA